MRRTVATLISLAIIAFVVWRIRDFAAEQVGDPSAVNHLQPAPLREELSPQATLEGRVDATTTDDVETHGGPSAVQPATDSVAIEAVLWGPSTRLAGVHVAITDSAGLRREAQTDAAGRVVFEGVVLGAVRVEGAEAGLIAESIEVELDDEPVEDKLYFRPSTSARGRVLRAVDGRPVAGARVIAAAHVSSGLDARSGIGDVWCVEETDHEGRFTLDRVPKNESLGLTALARGHARTIREVEIHEGGPTSRELVLRLHPGTTLRGVVVDRRGVAVPRAEVYVYPDGDDVLSVQPRGGWSDGVRVLIALAGRADEAGRFEVGGLALDARYGATAFASGRPRAVDVVGLHVAPDGTVPEVRLVVPDPASLEVVVRDEGGSPIVDARVTSGRENHAFFGDGEHPVDAAGRVVLTGLEARTHLVQADAPGFLSERELVVLVEGRTDRIELRLHRGAEVTGVVVDPEDLPLPRVHVIARQRADGRTSTAMTDEEGRFHLVGFPPGPLTLHVAGKEHALPAPLEVEAPAHDVRLQCSCATQVRARLVLPPGTEIPDRIRVGVFESTGAGWSHDEPWHDGRIRLLPGSEPRILGVQGRGFAPFEREIHVEVGTTLDLGEIHLSPGVDLRGAVVDGGGAPISGAAVTAVGHEWRVAQTDEQGRFELAHLCVTGVFLQIEAEAYLGRSEWFAPGAVAGDHRIVLARGGLFRLRVLDGEGVPVAATGVSVVPADVRKEEDADAYYARCEWGETDEQGRLELRVAPGSYRIEADLRGQGPITAEAELEEGAAVELTLRP